MSTVQVQFEATNKDLGFISDAELASIILDILREIDNLVLIRAHRSIIYLSMSTLEGILANVMKLNEKKVKQLPGYPLFKKKKKRIDKLSLEDEIELAKKLDIISKEHYDTFHKFRDFRNYMHPLAELRDRHKLDMGLGQMALGLINHTISKLGKIRFIDEKIWNVISGSPKYFPGQNKLEFGIRDLPTHSFLKTADYVKTDIEIKFELHIGPDSIFNFVYDLKSEDGFKMLRFETRGTEASGVLKCDQKFAWRMLEAYKQKLAIKTDEPNAVTITVKSNTLKVYLNGDDIYPNKTLSCNQDLEIGFFNEIDNMFLSNFEIKSI